MATWRRRARHDLDLLETRHPGPQYDFATERIFKRWRRAVLTTTDVQTVVSELRKFESEQYLRMNPTDAPNARVSVVIDGVTTNLHDAGAVAKYLESLENVRDVREIRVEIGKGLDLLALLVFQKRRPGIWIAVQGLVDEVPDYGNLAQDFERKTTRLLRASATSSLWTYLIPHFVVPGLQLSHRGESVSIWGRPIGRGLEFLGGAVAIAVIGWLVNSILG